MELIRRNSDYALRSIAYMAGFPKGKRFTIETIAKKQSAPPAFLKKIFQRLSSDSIVGSKTGPRGGYYLAKPASKISMKDVIESVQGPVSLNDCLVYKNACDRQPTCRIRKKLRNVQQQLDDLLGKSKIGEAV